MGVLLFSRRGVRAGWDLGWLVSPRVCVRTWADLGLYGVYLSCGTREGWEEVGKRHNGYVCMYSQGRGVSDISSLHIESRLSHSCQQVIDPGK